MSTPTDGLPAAWNRAQFTNAIKFAMQMGAPNQLPGNANPDINRVTFRIPGTAASSGADVLDEGGTPYDLFAKVTTPATHTDVTLTDVAIEWEPRQSANRLEGIGEFNRARATLYMFSTTADGTGTSEYDQIIGATHAIIGGRSYTLKFEGSVLALFDAEVRRIYAEADDEYMAWENG